MTRFLVQFRSLLHNEISFCESQRPVVYNKKYGEKILKRRETERE